MTDEEKAEEYVIKRYGIDKCYKEKNEETKKYMKIDVHIDYEEGYLCYFDGLAEGRKEKWHDLRKNPDDLPKQITLVIMYIIGNVYCNGWFNGDGWIIDNENMKKIDCETVIAWCEFPKFEG